MAEEDIRVKHLYYINFRRCLHVSIDHDSIDALGFTFVCIA